jgi:molecular chaperone GrpE
MSEPNTDNSFPPEAGSPAEAAMQARIDQLERQVSDYKLLIADFDNSRKRLTQDAERQRKYAHEPMAKDLLTVIDTLEWAIKSHEHNPDSGSLLKGVNATINLFVDVLRRNGVHKIEIPAGGDFDPNLHQAVMQQPSNDHAAGSVINVLQQGFKLHDRILRPASVVVASEPPAGGSSE